MDKTVKEIHSEIAKLFDRKTRHNIHDDNISTELQCHIHGLLFDISDPYIIVSTYIMIVGVAFLLLVGKKMIEINPNEIMTGKIMDDVYVHAFHLGETENSGTIDMKELRSATKPLGYDAQKKELKKIRFN